MVRSIIIYFIIFLFASGCASVYNNGYPKENIPIDKKIADAKISADDYFLEAQNETKEIFRDIDDSTAIGMAGGTGKTKADRFKNILQAHVRNNE